MLAELGAAQTDAHGVRRILCDQIDEAADLLRTRRISDGDIHLARKSLKKARATLRLLRTAVPSKVFDRENATLRDVARPLGTARDAKVLLDSLERLAKLYGRPAELSIPAAFRQVLAREQDTSRRAAKRQYSARAAPIRKLLTSQKHILTSRVRANGWEEIGAGLERVYRSGRKAMKEARATPAPECLHEWRKQAKYLSYQLKLLEPMCPGRLGALADQVHKLSDYLGDDHDLAVLREKIAKNAKAFPAPGGSAALLALIDRCQDRLRARAFFAGRRIYEDKPAAFAKKLERYGQRGRPRRAQRSH